MPYERYIYREIGYHLTRIFGKGSPKYMLISDVPE